MVVLWSEFVRPLHRRAFESGNVRGSLRYLICIASGYRSSMKVQLRCVQYNQPNLFQTVKSALYKKNSAMWIGYVGTEYKGLQCLNGTAGIHRAVEDELRDAIYKAGGILETNMSDLKRVSWKRSSRTDKGVHSLCTVISMELEVAERTWTNDADGIELADSFNAHLPPSIRVFGVAPVPKSFCARKSCFSRSYDYFLPASYLGFKSCTTDEEAKRAVEHLKIVLKSFEGRHAFHNYTVRSRYRTSQRRHSREMKALFINADENPEKSESGSEDIEEEEEEEKLLQRAYWMDENEEVDVVQASHYRRITCCTCGELEKLGDKWVVRVSITGESFMVHQIRKMIGTAIGVVRKILAENTIEISLCRHTRVILPIAPSEGLLLSGNNFLPFKYGYIPLASKSVRPGVKLSKGVEERMKIFWRDVLVPEMRESIDECKAPWNEWLEKLKMNTVPQHEWKSIEKCWMQWKQRLNENKVRKIESKGMHT